EDAKLVKFISEEFLLCESVDKTGSPNAHFWNIPSGRIMKALKNLQDPVPSPDGKTLAANMPDGLIFMDLKTFDTRLFRPTFEAISQMIFSPDSKTLAVFPDNGDPELWDVVTGKKRCAEADQLLKWHRNGVFSSDSRLLVQGATSGQVAFLAVWDVSSGAL